MNFRGFQKLKSRCHVRSSDQLLTNQEFSVCTSQVIPLYIPATKNLKSAVMPYYFTNVRFDIIAAFLPINGLGGIISTRTCRNLLSRSSTSAFFWAVENDRAGSVEQDSVKNSECYAIYG